MRRLACVRRFRTWRSSSRLEVCSARAIMRGPGSSHPRARRCLSGQQIRPVPTDRPENAE